jgi:hypothetical protein
LKSSAAFKAATQSISDSAPTPPTQSKPPAGSAAAEAPPQAPTPATTPVKVQRALVADIEKILEARILKADAADPFDLLVSPQGVYLLGYGVVFTAQLNLIVSPTINPFRQVMSKEDVARVRARKVARLPLLKQTMQQALINSAASLDPVPQGENVALSVSIFHFSWENVEGLPQQIVMHAERRKLLDRANAAAAIRVEEYE